MKSNDPFQRIESSLLRIFGPPYAKFESLRTPSHLSPIEFRQLGRSGFNVPALSLGTGTSGGCTEFFRAWGSSEVAEATRLVDICMEAGVNLFDTADVYSAGLS
jgi:hypothetical protein